MGAMIVAREFHDTAVAQAEALFSATGPQLSDEARSVAEGLEQEGQKVLTSVLCTPLGGSAQEFMREHLAPGTEVAEPYNLVLQLLDNGLDLYALGLSGRQAWALAARDVYTHEEETRSIDDNVVLSGLEYPRAVDSVRAARAAAQAPAHGPPLPQARGRCRQG